MKILNINNVFNQGSTGNILKDLHHQFQLEGHKSIICYARQRGKVIKMPNVYKFCTELESDIWHAMTLYCGTLPYGGLYFSTRKLIKIIKRERPDVVNLHCVNDWSVNLYKLLKFLGKNNIKTVITNHAEFFYTGYCGHAINCVQWTQHNGCQCCNQLLGPKFIDNTSRAWSLMKKSFEYHSNDNLIFIAVSPWVKSRFKLSPITNKFNCHVVENGVDTSIYHPYNNKNRKTKPIVFHVSARFNTLKGDIKGGEYIFELAKRLPNISFKLACGTVGHIDEIPSNIEMLGSIKDPIKLAKYYSEANLTIISSKRETFSMVTAESLCCGTPVVGFKAGGPESIAITDYSDFVEFGDIDALQNVVEYNLNKEYDSQQIAFDAKLRYGSEVMANNYIKVYNELLGL